MSADHIATTVILLVHDAVGWMVLLFGLYLAVRVMALAFRQGDKRVSEKFGVTHEPEPSERVHPVDRAASEPPKSIVQSPPREPEVGRGMYGP